MAHGQGELKRTVGLAALTLYGVGDILGAGIYGLVGKAAGQMGNAVWLAFFTSMIAAGLTGLSYASLGSRYPRAGGAAYVTHKAYRRGWLAYMVGLAVLASGLTSMATATRAFAGYFQGLFASLPISVIMIGFALALALLVYRGIRESMWANSLCTVIELSGLLIVILVGARYLGSVDYLDTRTPTNLTGEIDLSLILSGAVLTFYSFVGFEDMLNVGEEVINPKRTLPLGLIFAVSIASVVYMTISLIAVSVVPVAELAVSTEPLVDVVRRAAPSFPPSVFSIIAMFAVANTALLNFIMGSRLVFGMARDGLLPKALSKVHHTRRTPHVATGVLLLIFLTLALSGDISSLAKATSVLLLLCFAFVNMARFLLHRRKDEPKGAFEVPSVVPVFGAIICVLLLFSAKGPELLFAGIILIGIGVLYLVLRPKAEQIERFEESESVDS